MSDRVFIFDTTLRDGEQSCGCSMTVAEKLRMAHKLEELGVDVMEAGFPAASEGDLEAVTRVSRELQSARVAALARCHTGDIEAAARALDKAKHPRIHTFIATSPIHLKHKLKKTEDQVLEAAVKAIELARKYVDDVEFSAEDATRTSPEVLVRFSQAVVAAGARTVNLPDTVGYTTPAEMGTLIGTVSRALGDKAHRQRALPRRPGAGGGQLAGRRAGRRPADRVHHQRHRRAGRQLQPGGGGDGHERPQGRVALRHRHQHPAAVPGQPAAVGDHRRRSPAQQGHRRQERLRPRGGHPPGRLPEGAHHLRDHGAPVGGRARPAAWCWANTAAATPWPIAARSWGSR